MIENSSKTSPMYPKRKSEMSSFTRKFQDACKKNVTRDSGTKSEAPIINKIPTGDVGVPVGSRHSIEESKVSSDKVRPQKVVSGSRDNKNNQENSKQKSGTVKKNEDSNKVVQSVSKKSVRSLQVKKMASGSFGRKKDQTEKSPQVSYLPAPKRSVILKRIKTQGENPRLVVENKKRTSLLSNGEPISKKPPNKTVEPKRRKPSEIPLRKSRTDCSEKPKPAPTFLKKTVKEEKIHLEFYSDKKSFSTVDEVSLCSELYITIDAIPDSDGDTKPHKRDLSPRPKTREQESSLQRSSKNSSTFDFLEEKLGNGKKVKKLDLEKVKTSSFTVLQTDPTVLTRLKSLHKQNVLSKKKVNPNYQTKTKPITPKPFFNSILSKSSRRISSPRVIVKNKSSSRVKLKKSKNEIQENLPPPPELNENDWKILNEFLSGKKLNLIPRYWEKKNDSDRNSNKTQTLTKKEISKSLREKLVRWDHKFSRRVRNFEIEESKIPTPKRRAHSQDFKRVGISKEYETSKELVTLEKSNSVVSTKKVESFGYSKVKVPVLVLNDDKPSKEGKINKTVDVEKPERKGVVEEKEKEKEKEKPDWLIKGMMLKEEEDENPEKIKSETKVRLQLKIDLNLPEESGETSKNVHSCDWLFKNDTNEPNKKIPKLDKVESNFNVLPDSLSLEKTKVIEKVKNSEPSTNLIENYLNLEENREEKEAKGVKKKSRSDAGDRPLPALNPFSASDVSVQNKSIKVDHKGRNNLKKAHNKEDQREIFETEAPKLRRRNSEPISFSGYIWKRSNFPIFKEHKPSLSSMASSLRHLNTDDFDDFVFWEPVPSKMTSCWEMSLYQFKKPWSVLSCSVFRDNRLSSTPGLILENLRNGGNLSKRLSSGSHRERGSSAKENPFDVEPSIAQKNIDIRNWLAALNFPTAPSNSSDAISEGNFTSQTTVSSQNLNKVQVTPKRRKVLKNLKFPEKSSKILAKDKEQYIRTVHNSKEEMNVNLKDVVRENSGKFVFGEPFSSRSAEEKSVLSKTNYRNTLSEPKVFTQPEPAELETGVDEPPSRSFSEQQQLKILKRPNFYVIFEKMKLNICNSLVMFTLFIIVISFVLLVVYPIVSVDFIRC